MSDTIDLSTGTYSDNTHLVQQVLYRKAVRFTEGSYPQLTGSFVPINLGRFSTGRYLVELAVRAHDIGSFFTPNIQYEMFLDIADANNFNPADVNLTTEWEYNGRLTFVISNTTYVVDVPPLQSEPHTIIGNQTILRTLYNAFDGTGTVQFGFQSESLTVLNNNKSYYRVIFNGNVYDKAYVNGKTYG